MCDAGLCYAQRFSVWLSDRGMEKAGRLAMLRPDVSRLQDSIQTHGWVFVRVEHDCFMASVAC